jgi:hypothetical protein
VKVRLDLMGRRMIEGRTFGRVWRLFVKPWAWPYGFHAYGFRGMGFGPFGLMLFDRRPERPDGT